MTIDTLVEAARKLPAADRMRLVEQVWDSVAAEDGPIALSAEQDAELKRRMDRVARDGLSGTPWETLRGALLREARR